MHVYIILNESFPVSQSFTGSPHILLKESICSTILCKKIEKTFFPLKGKKSILNLFIKKKFKEFCSCSKYFH